MTFAIQSYSISYINTADSDDRTARARIRDAAVYCFARDGFSAPLRAIAQEAGVSVPLITHHYKTKEGLHQVCDEWVLERFLELKLLAIAEPATVSSALSDTGSNSVLTVYILRSFLDQTATANQFFARLLQHLRTVVSAGRAAGIINPVSDEEARLRLLASLELGSLLVEFVLNPPDNPRDFLDQVAQARPLVAHLEFYTQPFLAASPAVETFQSLAVKENHV